MSMDTDQDELRAMSTAASAIAPSGLTPADAGEQSGIALPEIRGPIAVTGRSTPFRVSTEDLAGIGYIEEEFFLSGKAHVYDWSPDGIKAVAGPSRYVTRVLVHRPRDPSRFSGNVEVELLNGSLGVDFSGTWGASQDYMTARGDVWIGITSKALTAKALQRFDPVRYAALDWRNPLPAEKACPFPSIIPAYTMGGEAALKASPLFSFPDSEDGLIWDIFGQLGTLLKSGKRDQILPGFREPKLFATGMSQSGMLLRTWLNLFHRRQRLADGKPIFDGYLMVAASAVMRINQCSEDTPPDDPRNIITVPEDVPAISIVSEGDLWLAARTRQPDRVLPTAGLVSYEIAGASHGSGSSGGMPLADMMKAGVDLNRFAPPPNIILNDFPSAYLVTGALCNLQAWANEGVPPPRGQLIETDASLSVQRDVHGNALGGVRTPYVDVPISEYHGILSDDPIGRLMGARIPFAPDKLKGLYADPADYVAKVVAAADRLVAERWVIPEAAEAIKAAARTASVPE